jgi:hypothetical protein
MVKIQFIGRDAIPMKLLIALGNTCILAVLFGASPVVVIAGESDVTGARIPPEPGAALMRWVGQSEDTVKRFANRPCRVSI